MTNRKKKAFAEVSIAPEGVGELKRCCIDYNNMVHRNQPRGLNGSRVKNAIHRAINSYTTGVFEVEISYASYIDMCSYLGEGTRIREFVGPEIVDCFLSLVEGEINLRESMLCDC